MVAVEFPANSLKFPGHSRIASVYADLVMKNFFAEKFPCKILCAGILQHFGCATEAWECVHDGEPSAAETLKAAGN